MEWFLIKANEHLGPFDEEGLKALYRDGGFTADALVWREGWADAKTYEEVFLADENQFKPISESENIPIEEDVKVVKSDELPPDLPPDLPIEDKKEEPHAGVVETYVQKERSAIMENPLLDEVEEETIPGQKIEIQHEENGEEEPEEVIDFNEFEFEYDKNEKIILGRVKKIAILAIIVLVAFSGYLYFSDREIIFKRPTTMSLGDYERLVKSAKADSSELRFAFALASDKRTLWASTNNPLKGEVFINLESKKGRVLGRDVEVKAKGKLSKGLITFKDFQFVKGNRFIDGYYDVEIYTVDDLTVPLFQKFFKPTDKQFRFINEFLITSMLQVDFEKQLKEFSSKKMINAEDFWIEVYQKYQTIMEITKKIEQGFERILNAPEVRWNQEIKRFRDRYSREYGVFFTEFVRANEASYQVLTSKDFDDRIEIVGNYERLSALSKKIGKETVVLLADLEAANISNMNDEQRKQMKENALAPFKLIIAECERKLAVLKN